MTFILMLGMLVFQPMEPLLSPGTPPSTLQEEPLPAAPYTAPDGLRERA
jgi:hypothetical protein